MIFQHKTASIQSFSKFCRRNFVVCFRGVLRLKQCSAILTSQEYCEETLLRSVVFPVAQLSCKMEELEPGNSSVMVGDERLLVAGVS